MSLAGNINLLATAIGQQIKTIKTNMLQSLSIGTVTTGAAGSNAAATITGVAPNQVLNLTIPQGAAGAGGGDLATEYTTTQPVSPTTGITLFTNALASRRVPAWVDPSGQSTSLQPSFASNRIFRMGAQNGVATISQDNGAIAAVGASGGAVSTSTLSFFASMPRAIYATAAATANSLAGLRVSSSPSWFLSNTPNMGGFHFVARCGVGIAAAGSRGFVGLNATSAALSPSAEPSTFVNAIGFGHNAASTNWFFQTNSNATGTATTVDLGASFPAKTSAIDFYEFSLYAPSGNASAVYWSARRLNDNAFVSGVATTALPNVNQLLQGHIHYTNGTTAATATIHIQSLYIESDN